MARPPNFSRNSSAASLLREDFMRYVSKHRRLGQNFPGQQSYYVSPRAQQEWWKRSRVKELFDSFPKLDVTNQELVRLEYLGVLSTLVHIGRGEMIRDFVLCGMHDRKFPFYSPPPNFPTGDLFTECFDEFAKRQWMFFPLIIPCRIPHEEALLDQHIIPINRKESIEERSGAQIFKIQLDPECNGQDHLHVCREACPLLIILKSLDPLLTLTLLCSIPPLPPKPTSSKHTRKTTSRNTKRRARPSAHLPTTSTSTPHRPS